MSSQGIGFLVSWQCFEALELLLLFKALQTTESNNTLDDECADQAV